MLLDKFPELALMPTVDKMRQLMRYQVDGTLFGIGSQPRIDGYG